MIGEHRNLFVFGLDDFHDRETILKCKLHSENININFIKSNCCLVDI